MTTGRQLSLLEPGHIDRSPQSACSSRAQFRCDGCGAVETKTFSCSRPCRTCPWRRGRITPLVRRLPAVPIRHWVLTLPSPWRDTLAHNAAALRKFRLVATAEILSAIECHGRTELGSKFVRAGAAVVLHPASGDLSLNVHFHLLVLDGVYVPDGGSRRTRFVPHQTPVATAALEDVARSIRAALVRLAPPSDSAAPELSSGRPQRVAPAGKRRRNMPPKSPAPDAVAQKDGICLHRSPRISATDRQSLARVAGYVTRPLVHPNAVDRSAPSTISLRLQRPGQDGATRLTFSDREFERRLDRLTTAGVPQAVTYHGALAATGRRDCAEQAHQLDLIPPGEHRPARPPRDWRCRTCGEPMRAVALERIG